MARSTVKVLKWVSLSVGGLVMSIQAALAGQVLQYSDDAFAKARASGHPVVLDFHAGWCPVCRAQKPIVAAQVTQKEFESVTVFEVDFDHQSGALKKEFHVSHQSTLVAVKASQEIERSIGETDPNKIHSFFEKAL